jgi:hypothetical protein
MRCQNGQNQTCDATGNWQNTGASTLQLLRNPNFRYQPLLDLLSQSKIELFRDD